MNIEDSRQCGCNVTGAPLAVKDMVLVGVTGGDSAHRGYLTPFDGKTVRMKWRFYTIPNPGEAGHETWKGDTWKYGGGATWMTGSYDAELNLFFGESAMLRPTSKVPIAKATTCTRALWP